MQILLDTHTFLWWITDNPNLSPRSRDLIGDGNTEVLISAASAWEIAIKAKLGKLSLPSKPESFVTEQMLENGFLALPVTVSHALRAAGLPDIHNDPFDRLLVAQCLVEHLPVVSADPNLKRYSIKVLW